MIENKNTYLPKTNPFYASTFTERNTLEQCTQFFDKIYIKFLSIIKHHYLNKDKFSIQFLKGRVL